MQRVRRRRDAPKYGKLPPADQKRCAAAVSSLLDLGQTAAPAAPAPAIPTSLPPSGGELCGPAGSGHDAVRTVVERLRDRLDRLLLSAGLRPAPSGTPPAHWLPGRPCPVDATRCVEQLQVGGVEVLLPFKPLPPQVAVIERVIQACEGRNVALLESPTGTGKSIALLSAALAWQRQAFEAHGAAPQIIYGVRTHVQLAQMVRELQKMPYRPRMAVIGSREQMCINAEVKASAWRDRVSLNLACRQAARRAVHPAVALRTSECACEPYAQLGGASHAQRVFERCATENRLWDVEDLVQVAQSGGAHGGCPYYTAHVLAGEADLVFCPHNYILDPAVSQCKSHHRQRWSLAERIVIVDEAHNAEQGCREAGSVEVSQTELRQWTAALDALLARRPGLRLRLRGAGDYPCAHAVGELRRLPERLAAALSAACPAPPPEASAAPAVLEGVDRLWGLPGHPGAQDFLRDAGLCAQGVLSRDTEEVAQELTDRLLRLQSSSEAASAEDAVLLGVLGRLAEVVTKLRLAALHPEAYVLGVKRDSRDAAGGSALLAAWLMSPGVVFDTFALQAGAVVLASGTLAPLGALASELASSAAFATRMQRPGPLEAGHIVGPAQVVVATVARFPISSRALVSTFDSWKNPAFLEELGSTILGLAQAIPAGMLCFFPSYAAVDACAAAWRAGQGGRPGIWEQLLQVKGAVIIEPRTSEEMPRVCAQHAEAVRQGRGALCLAVYRGKLSEGLSFNDDLCRGVVCIGVPYPQMKDPLVVAKRKWNDARRAAGCRGLLSGDQWYELQAYRAVNQALGRCIRHRFDFGALVLLDARWAASGERSRGLRQHLGRWLQPLVEEWPRAGCAGSGWAELAARLRRLFAEAPALTLAASAAETPQQPAAQPAPGPTAAVGAAAPGGGSGAGAAGAVRRPPPVAAAAAAFVRREPPRATAPAAAAPKRQRGFELEDEGSAVLPLRYESQTQRPAEPQPTGGAGAALRAREAALQSALEQERARALSLEAELRRRDAECAALRARLASLLPPELCGDAGMDVGVDRPM